MRIRMVIESFVTLYRRLKLKLGQNKQDSLTKGAEEVCFVAQSTSQYFASARVFAQSRLKSCPNANTLGGKYGITSKPLVQRSQIPSIRVYSRLGFELFVFTKCRGNLSGAQRDRDAA